MDVLWQQCIQCKHLLNCGLHLRQESCVQGVLPLAQFFLGLAIQMCLAFTVNCFFVWYWLIYFWLCRAGALIVHGTGLIALFTLLSSFDHYERYGLQFCSDLSACDDWNRCSGLIDFGQFSIFISWPLLWFCRAGVDPVAFPLITATILLYSSIAFLGVTSVYRFFRSFFPLAFDRWFFTQVFQSLVWLYWVLSGLH